MMGNLNLRLTNGKRRKLGFGESSDTDVNEEMDRHNDISWADAVALGSYSGEKKKYV